MDYINYALYAILCAWFLIGGASVFRLMYLEVRGRITFKSPRDH